MNADEALAIAETVLDEEAPRNDVQELVVRECWQGRRSDEAIANVSGDEKEYLKSTGAKGDNCQRLLGKKLKKVMLNR